MPPIRLADLLPFACFGLSLQSLKGIENIKTEFMNQTASTLRIQQKTHSLQESLFGLFSNLQRSSQRNHHTNLQFWGIQRSRRKNSSGLRTGKRDDERPRWKRASTLKKSKETEKNAPVTLSKGKCIWGPRAGLSAATSLEEAESKTILQETPRFSSILRPVFVKQLFTKLGCEMGYNTKQRQLGKRESFAVIKHARAVPFRFDARQSSCDCQWLPFERSDFCFSIAQPPSNFLLWTQCAQHAVGNINFKAVRWIRLYLCHWKKTFKADNQTNNMFVRNKNFKVEIAH